MRSPAATGLTQAIDRKPPSITWGETRFTAGKYSIFGARSGTARANRRDDKRFERLDASQVPHSDTLRNETWGIFKLTSPGFGSSRAIKRGHASRGPISPTSRSDERGSHLTHMSREL
ncbi:hypothetical protein CaCOL14_010144 [Colletotrichum acutatum]